MPTALQLSPEDWLTYRADSPAGNTATAFRPPAVEKLLDRARSLSLRIRNEFGAKRLVLFGSLARGFDFSVDSDIDLATEGLRGSQYLEVWRIAEEYFPEYSVDIIEIETASESVKLAILKHGIVL